MWEYLLKEYIWVERPDTPELNALGEEGWELVNFAVDPHFTMYYVFKRKLKK